MIVEDSEKLREWLRFTLEPLCDADPAALAKYVLALIKKDKEDEDLRESMEHQMDVFLQKETKPFVATLFEALESKIYLEPLPERPPAVSVDAEVVDASAPVAVSVEGKEEEKQPDSTTERHVKSEVRQVDHRPRRTSRRSPGPRRRHEHRRFRSRSRSRSPFRRRRSPRRRSRSRSRSPRRDESYVPTASASASALRQRCRDYDEKGFCMRGDQCKYDHGNDAVILAEDAVPPYNPAEPSIVAKTDTSVPPPPLYAEPYVPAPTPIFNVPPPGYPVAAPGRKRGYDHQGDEAAAKFSRRGRGRGRPATVQLAVRNIPPTLNNIGLLNNHFGRFGTLVNVQVQFEGDPASALVTYREAAEAEAAMNCSEAVLANRFIRLFYHNEKAPVRERLGHKEDDEKKRKEAEKVAAIAAIKKNQEVLEMKAQQKKVAECKRTEAAKKIVELRKSKQELLEKQMAEQKKLIGKIEEKKGSLKPEERSMMIKLIKTLDSSISKTREDLQKLVNSSASKKSSSELQKELLDAELELFTAQQDGVDATEFQKRVNALSVEAAKQGILPTSKSPGTRGSYRGGRGGFVSPRGRGGFYASPRGGFRGRGSGLRGGFATSIDRRPSKLKISGFDSDDKEAVIAHFKRFGEVIDTLDEEAGDDDDNATSSRLIIHYKTRRDAESAMAGGKTFGEQPIEVSWYTGSTPSDLKAQTSQEKVAASETSSEVHDDDYTPLDPTYLPPGLENDEENRPKLKSAEDEDELDEDLLKDDEEEEEDEEERFWKRENNAN